AIKGQVFDLDARDAEVGRARRGDFVEGEARGVEAGLVDHRGREHARVCEHAEDVLRRGGDVAHRAAAARGVAAQAVEAGDVRAEGQGVLLREVEVEARVELVAAARGRNRKLRELDVGYAVESAAVQVAEGQVLPLRAADAPDV